MARTLAPEDWQEIGRRYFREQKYEKAVEAFTEGIEAAVRPTVAQYDQRAASHDKLQDLNSALKDGRNMIKLDKKDVKGYLRTGDILQKMDNPAKAIEIYKYGMKNVPVANKEFKILQQLHDQLTRKLSPARSFDPFTVLPNELAQMVVEYLTFRQVVNCLRVSRGWKAFLTQCPTLWLDLDLWGARKDVSRVFIRNAVKYSQYKVQSFIVHRFRHPDIIRNLTTVCKDLTTLGFVSGGLMSATVIEAAQCALNLKRLVLHTEVTLDTVAQIMRLRPTLEHAEFTSIIAPAADGRPGSAPNWGGSFPNLRTLILQQEPEPGPAPRRWQNLGDLWDITPTLESVTIKGWSAIGTPDLSKCPLTHATFQGLIALPQLPQTVEQLFFTGDLGLSLLAPDLPRLTHLSLQGARDFDKDKLNRILSSRPKAEHADISNLQHLSLQNISLREGQQETSIFAPETGLLGASRRILTKSLQSLDLAAFPVTDSDLEVLAHNTQTSLNFINLSRTQITGAGVKDLVDNIPMLRTLILDGCERISSRDVVEYAEKKGIRVSMRMPEARSGTAGGRRVRYG